MAVIAVTSNHFKYALAKKMIDLSADTIKVLLMRSGFIFSKDNHATLKNIKTNSGSIALAVSDSANTFTRSSGSFIDNGFVAGNKITTGSSQANNQGPFLISVVTATVITVTTMAGGDPTLTDESASFTITSDDELDGGNGYTENTKTSGTVTLTEDNTNDYLNATFPTVTWNASGGDIGPSAGAILMDDTSSDDTIIGYINFGADQTATNGTSFNIASGTFRIV